MWTKKLAAMILAAVMIFSVAQPVFANDDSKYIERDGKTYVQVVFANDDSEHIE